MIIVMGDSWACGEWGFNSDNQYGLLHRGISLYMQEAGYPVFSFARGGSSNKKQVDQLLKTAASMDRPPDHIIWFLTDPFRDILQYYSGNVQVLEGMSTTLTEYQAQREHLLREQFNRIRSLKVLLIGGACPVPAWVKDDYSNIEIVVPDLRCWLLPDAEPCDTINRVWQYPDKADYALIDYWKQQDDIYKKHCDMADRQIDSDSHKFFWPDGTHPNRLAHRMLTDYLLQTSLNK